MGGKGFWLDSRRGGAFALGLYLYSVAAMFLIALVEPEADRLTPAGVMTSAVGPALVGFCAMALASRLPDSRLQAPYRTGLAAASLWIVARLLRTFF